MLPSLLAVIGLAVVSLIAAGVGDFILRGTGRKWDSNPERFVFGCAVGMGAIAYGILLLGVLHALDTAAIAALVLTVGAVSHRRMLFFLRSGARGAGAALVALRKPATALTALALAALALPTLVTALAPPNAADWDGLAYHLAMPKLFLQAHRIYNVAFSSHSNFPFTMEMLYTAGLAFHSVGLARAFNWWTGVLCCLGVYLLARRHLQGSGRMAALIFAGLPIVGWEATTSYADLGTAMFALLAVYGILNFRDTGDRGWLSASAILAGFSAGTKMTALIIVAVCVLWAGVESAILRNTIARSVRQGLVYSAVALCVASPWYIKSFIYTGNPVYPFFYGVFGGRGWNANLAELYRVSQLRFGIGTDTISLLKIPYALAFRPDKFYDVTSLSVAVGVTLLAALPVMLRLRYATRPAYARLLIVSSVQVLVWCFLTQQSRYLMPVLAVLSVASAYAICELSRSSMLRGILMAVVVAQLMMAIIMQGIAMVKISGPVTLGLESREDYLSRTLDIYPAIRAANSDLPKNARIVLFGDTRGFYLDRPYFWGDASHNATIPYGRIRSPGDLARRLVRMGTTHALVNFRYLGSAPWEPSQPSALVRGAVDEGYFKPVSVDQARGVGLFRISGRLHGVPGTHPCERQLRTDG